MKMRRLFLVIFCVALLPFTASPQIAPGVEIGGEIGLEPLPPANILWPEDIAVPAGRRGDCSTLTGPSGMLKSQTVKVGTANYTTCFGWDNYGNPQKWVDTFGFLTEFQYDLLGRPTLTKDPHGEEFRTTYNAIQGVKSLLFTL